MLNCKLTESLEDCIKDSFKKISLQLDLDKSMNCGSTVCALLLKGKEAIFINTGDSRVVCGGKDKNIVYQSVDHKPDHPDEVKRINKAGGFVFPLYGVWRVNGNLALSRSVGDLSMFPHIINTPDILKEVTISQSIAGLAIKDISFTGSLIFRTTAVLSVNQEVKIFLLWQ